ncbi:MAG: hypothetical protein GX344_07490, partial [Intrasporangiaceae bacterium]|nr:hypothetical protein [Intrasporangiaceae bacterium]
MHPAPVLRRVDASLRRRRSVHSLLAGLALAALAVSPGIAAAAAASPITQTTSGNIVVTEPGTVIDGLHVRGYIHVRASNVTIRNSTVTYGGSHSIRVFSDVSGTKILNTRVECTGSKTNGVVFGNYTADGVHLTGCRNGFLFTERAPATITNSTV